MSLVPVKGPESPSVPGRNKTHSPDETWQSPLAPGVQTHMLWLVSTLLQEGSGGR